MVPRDGVNAATAAVGPADAEKPFVQDQGPVKTKKCEKKVPKKIHKSEREKHKRGKQNDLFKPDRQNNGKACVLGETTRILKDLLSQVDSLRKENITLKNESHYVALERNELHDDNNMLRNEILELQNELRMRESNPTWRQGSTRSTPTIPHPSSRLLPAEHFPAVITGTVLPLQQRAVIEQCHAVPPRELQLFPEAASSEDSELSQDHGISNNVTRPQARYPTPMVTLSVNPYPNFSRTGNEQQCSSGTSEEDALRRP